MTNNFRCGNIEKEGLLPSFLITLISHTQAHRLERGGGCSDQTFDQARSFDELIIARDGVEDSMRLTGDRENQPRVKNCLFETALVQNASPFPSISFRLAKGL